MKKEKQPAYVNYFFKGGFIEFANTIKGAFGLCKDSIVNAYYMLDDEKDGVLDFFSAVWDVIIGAVTIFEGGFEDIWDAVKEMFQCSISLIKFFFALFNLVFVAVLTTVLTCVFSVLHTCLLCISFLIVYVLFAIVWLFDTLYCNIKRIATSCPACQTRHALPYYQCECGAIHTSLKPSKYGIFKRKCQCGRKLPVTFMNGRGKLGVADGTGKWICPTCSFELSGSMQMDIPIIVVGGPSSGKSCFINRCINEIDKNADDMDCNFEYIDNVALADDYKSTAVSMDRGVLPLKTSNTRLQYYQFYYNRKKSKIRNLVSICDVAGETYESITEMETQIGFNNAQAFMILVDPLSINMYKAEVENAGAYNGSYKSMDEVFGSLTTLLVDMNKISSKTSSKMSIAVVFTKCDIPGLDEKIGAVAVDECMATNKKAKTPAIAKNIVCENFLREYGESNFVNALNDKFTNIQYFTSSALGHVADGTAFEPYGVREPALWLIDSYTKSLALAKMWKKSNKKSK